MTLEIPTSYPASVCDDEGGSVKLDLKGAHSPAADLERLAIVGKRFAWMTHEGLNLLQRVQSSVDFLSAHVSGNPILADCIREQQRALADLAWMYEDIRNYASPIQLRPMTVDIPVLWRAAWNDLKPVWQGRDVSIHESFAPTGRVCSADSHQLSQVFRNLFQNAVEATEGPVRIEVGIEPETRKKSKYIQFFVRDDGPGFTPIQRQKAFQAFFSTKSKGTGLGLVMCRRIIDAHGGTIELKSDSGAHFLIKLPLSDKS